MYDEPIQCLIILAIQLSNRPPTIFTDINIIIFANLTQQKNFERL